MPWALRPSTRSTQRIARRQGNASRSLHSLPPSEGFSPWRILSPDSLTVRGGHFLTAQHSISQVNLVAERGGLRSGGNAYSQCHSEREEHRAKKGGCRGAEEPFFPPACASFLCFPTAAGHIWPLRRAQQGEAGARLVLVASAYSQWHATQHQRADKRTAMDG